MFGVSTLPAPLFRIFVEEARQNVTVLRVGLAALGPTADAQAWEALTRAAHTLGGIARTAGFPDITVVTSVIENAPLGSGNCTRTLEALQSAVVTLEELVDTVAAGNTPELTDDRRADLIAQATAFRELGVASPAAPLPWPARDRQATTLDSETSAGSSVEGASSNAATSGEAAGDMPPPGSTTRGASERRVLKDDIDAQLLPIFLDEIHDLGPLIGEDLRHLRNEPNDVAAFDSLRRVLHTIKGGARMVGAIRLGELVHVMEGRLEGAFDRGALSPEILDLLEGEFDRLTSGFEMLEHGEPEQDLPVRGRRRARIVRPRPPERRRSAPVPKRHPRSRRTFAWLRIPWIACSIRPVRSASRAAASRWKRRPSSSSYRAYRQRRQASRPVERDRDPGGKPLAGDAESGGRARCRVRSARVRPLHEVSGAHPANGRKPSRRDHGAAASGRRPG